jgi:hypothetical protein
MKQQLEEVLCNHCGIRIADSDTCAESCQVCEDRAILDGVASVLQETADAARLPHGDDIQHLIEVMENAADTINGVINR